MKSKAEERPFSFQAADYLRLRVPRRPTFLPIAACCFSSDGILIINTRRNVPRVAIVRHRYVYFYFSNASFPLTFPYGETPPSVRVTAINRRDKCVRGGAGVWGAVRRRNHFSLEKKKRRLFGLCRNKSHKAWARAEKFPRGGHSLETNNEAFSTSVIIS